MEELPEDERRNKLRVPFETDVSLSTESMQMTVQGSSLDLSLKGMFVKTDEQIPVNTECDIEIKLLGSSDDITIFASGTIVRVDDKGVGVHFESVDIDSYVHLKNIVMYNAEKSV